MPQHIGIVGCSAEGAALCYRTICREGAERLGPHAHPEITMHTFPLNRYMLGIEQGNWQHVGQLLATSANRLAAVGAQFAICPDNTVHQAFDEAIAASSIPWLHIAAVVAEEAMRRGFSRIGILGTRYLMEGPVYRKALARAGIVMVIPETPERRRINSCIFDELVYGSFTESTRRYFVQAIQNLQQDGCQAVVLGCTEIPLLVRPEDSPLPTLDSTRLLARAALDRALESEQ